MTLLLFVDILSNNVFAQNLQDRTLYEGVRTAPLYKTPQIDVGSTPIAIVADEGNVYVANAGPDVVADNVSDTVSVISIENSTKIKDIRVGDTPVALADDENGATVYVANAGSDTVSVINATTNTKIKDIRVGDNPVALAIHDPSNTVYVANARSDTVSVISTETNERIVEDIRVGDNPVALAIHDPSNTVYVANSDANTVSVISTETNERIVEDIRVGESPEALAVKNDRRGPDTVYVANAGSDTLSVISIENNTNIGEDIRVGDNPTDIGFDPFTNAVYVANLIDDTVSVISTETNERIVEDIPVVDTPVALAISYSSRPVRLYVANANSDTVSVIISGANEKIEDIHVGANPVAIHSSGDAVYVANSGSDSISVILDAYVSKALAGVTFHVNPFGSGRILCDGLTTPAPNGLTTPAPNGLIQGIISDEIPLNLDATSAPNAQTLPSPTEQYIYVYSRDKCKATPNEGFEFASWEENLEDNSTQLISVAGPSSPLDSLLEYYSQNKSWDKPEATLDITKFGTFTANFREAPSPLPPEFWAQMYAVIATVITALFIPSIVGWFKSKREAKKLNYFHKQVAALYQDGKLDENDIEALDHLRNGIGDAYSEGKLNEKHYEGLRNETSTLYEEIFRKKIDALNSSDGPASKKPTQEQLTKIKNEIKYAFSKGKINEKHYALLNEDISNLDSKERDTS